MLKKVILLNILFVIFLSSCNLFSNYENNSIRLNYSINIDTPRTLIPSFNGVIDHYTIEGTDATGTHSINQEISTESGIINSLTESTWDFIVTAYDSSDNILASGSSTTTISGTEENSISFNLEYIKYLTQKSTGDLSITIEWPENVNAETVSVIWAGLTYEDVDITGLSSYTFSESGQTSGSSNILVFKLYSTSPLDNSYLISSVTEAVHIYDDQITSKTITLKDTDFLIPTNPSNVTIENYSYVLGYEDSLEISWDTETTAVNYQVYFSYVPTGTIYGYLVTEIEGEEIINEETQIDITSFIDGSIQPYYNGSATNSQTIGVPLPEKYNNAYVYHEDGTETKYELINTTNFEITITVTSLNNYGESEGTTKTYTTAEVFN